jgi:TetR/AcrR family tetracycline transcriptional repressor
VRGPGQRAGLTRAAVLTEARALVAEAGPDGLTMRALARRLDVAPNALYSHVADKTDLLDQLLDDLLGAVDADPAAGAERMMTSTYETLLGQSALVPLFVARQGARGPNAVRLGEVLDGQLAAAGVADVPEARRVLIVHAIGFAAFDAGQDLAATRPRFVRSLRWLLDGMTKAPTPEG